MNYKDTLELLNMFTTAAQIAKSQNKYEYHLKMDEATLVELLKKAFPKMKDNTNILSLAKQILNS